MISEVQETTECSYPSYVIGNNPTKGYEMARLKMLGEKCTTVILS